MKIEVFGSGCPNCIRAYENIKKAAEELNVSPEVVKVEDMDEIISRGIMMTPAIAVEGEIKMSGKVPTVQQAKELMK